MAIALNNRAVYARGQAKIIRINNETPHAVSLTKPLTTKDTKEHQGKRERGSCNLFWNCPQSAPEMQIQKCKKEWWKMNAH
jgi:hypothetical protein